VLRPIKQEKLIGSQRALSGVKALDEVTSRMDVVRGRGFEPPVWAQSFREHAMKILIAVDGSDYTKRMLAYLAAHDELLGDRHEFTVVHSVLAVTPNAARFVDAGTLQNFYESEAEDVFRPIRAFFKQQRIEPRFVKTIGHAAQSIASLAQEGRFDLLVMGCRGHGDLANLVLGSVATKVLALCSTPVLLIR
jgi:nucleotide-binding universal stress UspA family protein